VSEAGDPRGHHVALEHAIRNARPAEAVELSARQAVHFQEQRSRIVGRPCGVPFREKYRGRQYIRFTSTNWHRLRGGRPAAILRQLQTFALENTDAQAPFVVSPGSLFLQTPEQLLGKERPQRVPTKGEAPLARLLPNATLEALKNQRIFVNATRAGPVDVEAIDALCKALGDGSITYLFRFSSGNQVPLPYQEAGHYSGLDGAPTAPVWSHVTAAPKSRGLQLALFFPFESFEDPGFLRLVDAVEVALGKVLTPSRFYLGSPLVNGKRMDEKKHPFSRPAAK